MSSVCGTKDTAFGEGIAGEATPARFLDAGRCDREHDGACEPTDAPDVEVGMALTRRHPSQRGRDLSLVRPRVSSNKAAQNGNRRFATQNCRRAARSHRCVSTKATTSGPPTRRNQTPGSWSSAWPSGPAPATATSMRTYGDEQPEPPCGRNAICSTRSRCHAGLFTQHGLLTSTPCMRASITLRLQRNGSKGLKSFSDRDVCPVRVPCQRWTRGHWLG